MGRRNCSDLQYHLFTVLANMTFSIVMIAALTITALPLSWPAMTMRENLQVIQVFDFVRYFGDVVWDEACLKKLKKNKAEINFLSLYALLPMSQEPCTSACVAATIALLHTPISLCMLTVMFKMTVYTVVTFILQQSQNVAFFSVLLVCSLLMSGLTHLSMPVLSRFVHVFAVVCITDMFADEGRARYAFEYHAQHD